MRERILIVGVMMFFALIGISFGGLTTPLPIAVQLTIPNDVLACYYEVKITNERTGEVVRGLTNEHFEYLVDWANSDFKYQYGDEFKIEALGKIVEIRYTASPPTELIDINTGEDINFVEISIDKSEHADYCIEGLKEKEEEEEIIIEPECPDCICPDCNCQDYNYPECNCPEDLTPYNECDECCPECEGTDLGTLILYILSFFGIGLATGEGIKLVIRKRKDTGKLEIQVTQHKHIGISGYHSIYRVHDATKTKHPKGEINPTYDSYGRYIPKDEGEE